MWCLMFSSSLISNVHKSIIVMNSLDTRFSRNVFKAVQKTCTTCFIGSKTTWLRLVVLNPGKTLLLMFYHYLKSDSPELTVFIINRIPSHLFFSFGDKASHLLINKDVCATPLVFQSQATVQCQLHSIDPDIFPLLETNDIPVSTNNVNFDTCILICHFEKVIFCNTL